MVSAGSGLDTRSRRQRTVLKGERVARLYPRTDAKGSDPWCGFTLCTTEPITATGGWVTVEMATDARGKWQGLCSSVARQRGA